MTDELLPYYQRELAFIRKMGAEFAQEFPDVAEALSLGPDSSQDPHVERMIMAFAFLTARIRFKLDDDFPEITTALLEILYPHYLAPIPSMAIAEFQLDRGQAGLTEGYRVAWEKLIETEPVAGEECCFRTAYPVTLWPIEVVSARLGQLSAAAIPPPEGANAILRLGLKCFAPDMTFSKFTLSKLRFFLNGQTQHVYGLYDLIFNNVLEVTVANVGKDPNPVRLGRGSVVPVGFEEDEGLLPYSPRSFLGYRLLNEYFAFPPKFFFFDVEGFGPSTTSRLGNHIEICFFLNRTTTDLEQNISRDTFRLGCTPIVNLFKQRADAFRLTQTETEYRVVPDARRPLSTEVYTIDRVTGTSPDGQEVEYAPFFSFKHGANREKQQTFWSASRRASVRSDDQADNGTEVYLSFVDLGFTTQTPANWEIQVEVTCLNRDLPARLPFGGGQPALKVVEGGPLVVSCLTPPTPTVRPPSRNGALWRLISQLTLNHLSIADEEQSPNGLREILKLYDFTDSAETRSKIAGITTVGSRPAVLRVRGDGGVGFCRGVEVTVQFDEERFSDNSLFMFASVLERFLGLYCSINSFTQLLIGTKQRKGILRKWPPRAASKVLL